MTHRERRWTHDQATVQTLVFSADTFGSFYRDCEAEEVSTLSGDSTRVVCPLFQGEEGGSIPASPLQVSDLVFERCPRKFACALNREWHSRLPEVEWQPMKYAFHARYGDVTYAVALWSAPVTNMIPNQWLELRRMACSPEFPKNGASCFLSWMVRYLRKSHPEHERLISYQDTDVHLGTIYKASGWVIGRIGMSGDWNHASRQRPTKNGIETNRSQKVRWEKEL